MARCLPASLPQTLTHKRRGARDLPDPGYLYVWEYEVRPEKVSDFVAEYGPNGAWVQLFRGSVGYLRTELHRDNANPNRFLTLDYWESADDWQRFRRERSAEFEELDRRCAELTVSEREIGRFRRTD